MILDTFYDYIACLSARLQVPKGWVQVSGGVSVPCGHATPVVNIPWKPLKIR